jgi:predicted nucleic acid-binding protein
MIKIYLDTCVWGRPFDDQTDKRISEETVAFFEIAWKVDSGEVEIIGSDVLFAELEDISDEGKRERIRLLASRAISWSVRLDEGVKGIALELEKSCKSYGADSLHIASALKGEADFFITTDYELMKKKKCIKQKFDIDVKNPIDFVRNLYG